MLSPIGEALNANSKDIIDIMCVEYPQLMLNHFKSGMRGKHSLHFAAQNGNVSFIKWYLARLKIKQLKRK